MPWSYGMRPRTWWGLPRGPECPVGSLRPQGGLSKMPPQPRAIFRKISIAFGENLEFTPESKMHSLHHLGHISFQFTAQSSSSSINAWTRVPTMGPATPELFSAKASKVQRLLIGFRRSSRFPHAIAGAAQTAVVQVQAPVSRDLFRGYLR